ncbi:hypothetical protein [Staphylococcus simulans]|uniref:hypothetical protein n=1 Tax=Staphylococcus simulans TaxID=1286 RepID=UPI000D045A9C|nr:hypothetical protein [Staphylococcus simulans]
MPILVAFLQNTLQNKQVNKQNELDSKKLKFELLKESLNDYKEKNSSYANEIVDQYFEMLPIVDITHKWDIYKSLILVFNKYLILLDDISIIYKATNGFLIEDSNVKNVKLIETFEEKFETLDKTIKEANKFVVNEKNNPENYSKSSCKDCFDNPLKELQGASSDLNIAITLLLLTQTNEIFERYL